MIASRAPVRFEFSGARIMASSSFGLGLGRS